MHLKINNCKNTSSLVLKQSRVRIVSTGIRSTGCDVASAGTFQRKRSRPTQTVLYVGHLWDSHFTRNPGRIFSATCVRMLEKKWKNSLMKEWKSSLDVYTCMFIPWYFMQVYFTILMSNLFIYFSIFFFAILLDYIWKLCATYERNVRCGIVS